MRDTPGAPRAESHERSRVPSRRIERLRATARRALGEWLAEFAHLEIAGYRADASPELEQHDLSCVLSKAPHAFRCVYPHESTPWAFVLTAHYLGATDRSTGDTPIRGILAAAPQLQETGTPAALRAPILTAFSLRVGYGHETHAACWLASAERLITELSTAPAAVLARNWIAHVTYRDAQRTLLDKLVAEISRPAAPRRPSKIDALRRAAEGGDARAAYACGLAELNGIGTRSRPSEGVRWLEQAAVQGHSEAQYELGAMYGNGWSVPRDAVVALAWLIAARRSGHDHARQQVTTLTERMTNDSIARAEQLSEELTGSLEHLPRA